MGSRKAAEDVELIASVPFSLTVEHQPEPKAEGSPLGRRTGQGFSWAFSTFDLDRFSERIDWLPNNSNIRKNRPA